MSAEHGGHGGEEDYLEGVRETYQFVGDILGWIIVFGIGGSQSSGHSH